VYDLDSWVVTCCTVKMGLGVCPSFLYHTLQFSLNLGGQYTNYVIPCRSQIFWTFETLNIYWLNLNIGYWGGSHSCWQDQWGRQSLIHAGSRVVQARHFFSRIVASTSHIAPWNAESAKLCFANPSSYSISAAVCCVLVCYPDLSFCLKPSVGCVAQW